MTLAQKGTALVAIPLLFQLAFVVAVFRSQREQVAAEAWAGHTKEVIAKAREIQAAASDAHAAVRGYVISRDAAFAEPFLQARADMPRHFAKLEELVRDNPDQTARCRELMAAVAALTDWQGDVDRLIREGKQAEGVERVRSGRGNAMVNEIRQRASAFLAEEERLDHERVQTLDRSRARLENLFIVGGVAAVVCTLVIAYAFRRGVARRVAELERNARRLAAGDALPQPPAGDDEIARLDRAFRGMAADLTRASETVQDLYDNAPCGYHALGPDGTYLTVNRTELTWLGYGAAELVGRRTFGDLLTAESRERFRGNFARFKADGSVHDLEYEMVRRDGTTFPVLLSATAVVDADGNYQRSRSTLTDLTVRKRAEAAVQRLNTDLEGRLTELDRTAEALRASEEQFRLLVDGVRDYAILLLDPDGRVATWNAGASRIKGYQAEEVVGRHFSLFYPSDAVERHWPEHELSMARSTGRFEDEGWRVRKDGTRFWANVVITAIRDEGGELRGFGKVTRDVTERREAEAAVRLFADVTRNIPIGLLIYQLDDAGEPPVLRVRSGNRDATRLLGIDLNEAVGRAVADVFPAIPPDQLRRYTAVAASGTTDDLGEFRYGDGRVAERWWAVLAFPLPDRSVGVSFQDVTARKQAESEVRRLNAELEDRVRARTAELEAVNRDLTQKNAENEMFVYSVSHDLRSPLVNLQGFSKELAKGGQTLVSVLDDPTVPADVRDRGLSVIDGKMAKSIGFIQTAVLRLSGIIDALLRLSRVGRVEYRWGAVDVGQVVGQVVGAIQGTVAERGATVRVGELPPAWGDRTAVGQVFGNLIGNALTYLDPARPGLIEVGCLPPTPLDDTRTYFVRDNGLGIAEAHRQKIFQAFQRAHPGVGSGEGLGLAIVSRVVDRHRGQVRVESRPGEGSTFFVTLPASADARRANPGENR